jgi:hypothetical protein
MANDLSMANDLRVTTFPPQKQLIVAGGVSELWNMWWEVTSEAE